MYPSYPKKPLAIDLFAGLGGWTEGLLAEGYDVVGFDIERHDYGTGGYPAQLVLQDVLTLHGSQFRNASLIVASPPCQEFSYMSMPWTIAKQKAAHYRANPELIETQLKALFNCCFRIQREACDAAGRHIPMVVENVKGAQPWVGKANANFGSRYPWGDVQMVGSKIVCGAVFGRFLNPDKTFTKASEGMSFKKGTYESGAETHRNKSSKSKERKAYSAKIAKIPLPLSRYIASVYYPTAAK